MSVQTEIMRLQGLKGRLKTKTSDLGLTESTANLEDCVAAVEGVANRGAVTVGLVAIAESYAIQAGYHSGGGTVAIAASEQEKILPGNIKNGVTILGVPGEYTGEVAMLQAKTVTPTKAEQQVTADEGYDALGSVTVGAIPAAYQDVTSVTAGAADVLANKIIVGTDGAEIAGTMPNNGGVAATIDGLTTTEYVVPAGYHSGAGKVTLTGDIEAALAAI